MEGNWFAAPPFQKMGCFLKKGQNGIELQRRRKGKSESCVGGWRFDMGLSDAGNESRVGRRKKLIFNTAHSCT